MFLGSIVQNATEMHLGRVRFVFLAARYVRLDLGVNCTKLIELATSAVHAETVDILYVDSCAVVWLFCQSIAPRFVRTLVFGC